MPQEYSIVVAPCKVRSFLAFVMLLALNKFQVAKPPKRSTRTTNFSSREFIVQFPSRHPMYPQCQSGPQVGNKANKLCVSFLFWRWLFTAFFCFYFLYIFAGGWKRGWATTNWQRLWFAICRFMRFSCGSRKAGKFGQKLGSPSPEAAALLASGIYIIREWLCVVCASVCVCVRAATSVSGLADSQFRRVDLLRLQFSPGSPSTWHSQMPVPRFHFVWHLVPGECVCCVHRQKYYAPLRSMKIKISLSYSFLILKSFNVIVILRV